MRFVNGAGQRSLENEGDQCVIEEFPRTPSGKICKDPKRTMTRVDLAGATSTTP